MAKKTTGTTAGKTGAKSTPGADATGSATKAKSNFFTKENFLASMLGFASLKDWAASAAGKVVVDKITGKIFGIGPDDEALFKKACTFLFVKILKINANSKKAKGILLKINQFIWELEEKGYSSWWFRNVLATMRKGDNDGENQAARTLHEIIQGHNFDEMMKLAGPDLIQKTYLKKAEKGWELIMEANGKINLLVDFAKVKNSFSQGVQDFKDGFTKPVFLNRYARGAFIIFIIMLLATVAFVFGTV